MPRPAAQALLLVDGYNMVGVWSDLKHTCEQEGLEAARRELVEALVNYSAFQGFNTQVVFDSQYQDTRGTQEVITPHLSVYFTEFGQTADTFIEKTCAQYRYDLRKFEQRLIVATSDRAHQQTVTGYGAEWMSAQQLSQDVDLIAHRIHRKQQKAKKSANRFLMNAIDPVARERLSQLRKGMH